jgi:ABC-type glutathione transport system ATPase component
MTHDLAVMKEFADRAIVLKVLGRRNGLTQEEIVEAITPPRLLHRMAARPFGHHRGEEAVRRGCRE